MALDENSPESIMMRAGTKPVAYACCAQKTIFASSQRRDVSGARGQGSIDTGCEIPLGSVSDVAGSAQGRPPLRASLLHVCLLLCTPLAVSSPIFLTRFESFMMIGQGGKTLFYFLCDLHAQDGAKEG